MGTQREACFKDGVNYACVDVGTACYAAAQPAVDAMGKRYRMHFDRMIRRVMLLLAMTGFCGCAQKEGHVESGVMTLDVCGAKQIENPTDEQIRIELSSLSTQNEDSFAILGPTNMTYIQVSGDKRVGFDLEYQEGSVDAHFKTVDGKISFNAVVRAFIAYRDGVADWQDEFTFVQITW